MNLLWVFLCWSIESCAMQFSQRMSLGPFLLGLLAIWPPQVIHFWTLSMITGLAETQICYCCNYKSYTREWLPTKYNATFRNGYKDV